MSLLQFLLINLNLVVLFGLYFMFSRGKRHLHFNRFYLLCAPILAIVIPFISFAKSSTASTWISELPAITILNERTFINTSSLNTESMIYSLGSILFLIVLIYQIAKIVIPKKATYLKSFMGASVFTLNSQEATHSFFNRIYLNPNHLDNEEVILIHEHAHCKGLHSVDLIIMAIYKALFWFNPAIYSFNKATKENHEFIADQKVMSGDVEASNYGRLLLDMNFESSAPPLTNTFNIKSMLLKRIENLNIKNQYPMKNLFVIPVVAGLALLSMSMTSVKIAAFIPATSIVQTGEPDVEPSFPGGASALMEFIGSEVHYPKALVKENAEGKVFVQFVISKTGEVTKITILRGSSHDEMDKEAIRVIEKMPNWTPGKKDGIAVDAEVILPIQFKLK